MKKLFLILVVTFCLGTFTISAQTNKEDVTKANNPLADLTGIAFQNYYSNNLESIPNQSINSMQLRLFKPIGKFLIRATMPITTAPSGTGSGTAGMVKSGLGDFSLFGTYTFVSEPDILMGAGPMVIAPTATEDILGVDAWQFGAAFILFNMKSPVLQYGFLTTYQHSVWADSGEESDMLTFQPYNIFQLGKGTYLRSTGVMQFGFEKGTYNIPFGVGIGQVVKSGETLFNMYIEPQYSVLHHSVGQPQYQILAGLNVMF